MIKNVIKYTLGLPMIILFSITTIIGCFFAIGSALLFAEGIMEEYERYKKSLIYLWKPLR